MAFDRERGNYSRTLLITVFLAGAVWAALPEPGLRSTPLAEGLGQGVQQTAAEAAPARNHDQGSPSNVSLPATALPAVPANGGRTPPVNTPANAPTDNAAANVNVRQPNIHTRPLQVNVNMVVVGVTVTDPYDRIVTGLDKSNFEVFDEKVPQDIQTFSTEDVPISVGMIFDASGSMSDKIEKSKEAALQFFKTSNPEDEFMLIQFNERPDLISAFTS